MAVDTPTNADKQSNELQILQSVFDPSKQALKTTATFTFDPNVQQSVQITAADGDNIAIADAVTGVKAKVDNTGALRVTSSGGTFVEVSPSDFRTFTYTVTASPQAIAFSGFTMVSISLYALPNNTVELRIGKSDVATNYYILTPGSTANLPLQASTSTVYFMLNGSGSAQISVLALGS